PHAAAARPPSRRAGLAPGLAGPVARLLGVGPDDALHAPYRRPLVAGYDAVSAAARQAGAYGATLSGSGPTIVALALAARATQVGDAMVRAWRAQGVAAGCHPVARPAGGPQTVQRPLHVPPHRSPHPQV